MESLWGKFHTSGVTLHQHTLAVVNAGEALFGTENELTRLGECWLRFFKLPSDIWKQFYWNLLAAGLLHDWGKANDGMQRVLTGRGDQAIRHEHFSALLIGLETVTEWLKKKPILDVPLVLSAVLTHHLKASGKKDGWATIQNGQTAFKLQQRATGFAELVAETRCRLALPELDPSLIPERWTFGGGGEDVRNHRGQIQDKTLEPFWREIDKDVTRRCLLTAVRAALIAADAAGSGYVREGYEVKAEVWRQFVERKRWTGESIRNEIIDKRIADLNERFEKRCKPPFEWNEFQNDCADPKKVPDRALLLAPCGSGKTLAAWRWIAAPGPARTLGYSGNLGSLAL